MYMSEESMYEESLNVEENQRMQSIDINPPNIYLIVFIEKKITLGGNKELYSHVIKPTRYS